ncbi:GNAT family N-acetyltransferase [Tropicimonas aquimaris]|uniref:GNAT family N-acetyltransferase n=1 Tax=Tropicimonas aquimaris TaxID=914152 RepID=A0ABW3IW85_9RHOB
MTQPEGEHRGDYQRLSEALYAALRPDPFYAALEGGVAEPARARQAMLYYYEYSIREAVAHGHAVLPDAGDFGASIWAVPLAPEQERELSRRKKEMIAHRMGDTCLRIYAGICEFMAEATSRVTSNQDWYLSILGVAPEQQGQGLGAGLLEPVLEKADRAGVATYLETFTPGNMPFYRRLGYQDVGRFQEPITDGPYWVMRRPPSS